MENLKKNAAVETVHNIDPVTGLYDTKAFDDLLFKEVLRASRNNYPVSLAFMSIDGFSGIGRACGRAKLDAVLKSLASLIKKNVRAYHPVARCGSDRFAVIFPSTDKKTASSILKSVKQKVSGMTFAGAGKTRITFSSGVAAYPVDALNKISLMEKAESAVSLARKEGGNRVVSCVTTSKTAFNLALCPPSLSPFYSFLLIGIREIIEDAGNVRLRIYGAPSDIDFKGQMAQLDRAVKDKPDAIALCNKQDVGKYVQAANGAKIPVFGFNIMKLKMLPEGQVVTYVGYDQREAGSKVGEYVARVLRGCGKVAVIEGVRTENDSIDRKKGFLDIIRKYGGIKLVGSVNADWLRDRAEKSAARILDKHPQLDAFFAVSDEMAIGAALAVKKRKRQGKTLVIGLDGSKNGLEAVKSGLLTATMNANPLEMGRVLMRTILRSTVKGEKIPSRIESPIMMVDPVNIDTYLL